MQLTELQKQVVSNNSNCLIIGGPGTGKTISLVAKVKRLVTSGVTPEKIAIACFNPKSVQMFKAMLESNIGTDAKRINYGTLNELAVPELKAAKMLEGDFANNAQIRRLLHQVKILTGFKGSIYEAEHIVRNFKSKAKKPQAGEEFYEIFEKYQELLTSRNWFDSYDCLRQHLIGIRNNIAQPNRIKYLFVDGAQDMNYIQVLWLLEHANVGVKINLFMDDDQCMYQRSGAIGAKVIDIAEECDVPFEKIILNKGFRLSKDVIDSAYAVVSLADQRYKKGELEPTIGHGEVKINSYNSKKQEVDSLISNIKQYFRKNQKSRIAVITRNDEDAMYASKHLSDSGINHEEFSNSIWDMPGAIVVIDMLELLLGTATDKSLKNILITLGVNDKTVNEVFSKGVQAAGWLQNGAKLDKSLISDDEEIKNITKIQTILTSYYKLRTKLSIKDIFKSLCFELMKEMNPNDKIDALRAIERVLAFKGDMKKNIDEARKQKRYRMKHPILVGPVREFKDLEFDAVFMPFCHKDRYPYDFKVLGRKNSNDRRLFFTSMTTSRGDVYISYSDIPSTYVKAIENRKKEA